MILKMSHTIKQEGVKTPGRQGWIWYDNVLIASCNYEPQYGGKVITIYLKNQVDPTCIPLREVAYLCNDEGKTIEVLYPEFPPKNEGDTEQKTCSKCKHAHKVESDTYDKTYECDASEYDIENYTCFVPKEEADR